MWYFEDFRLGETVALPAIRVEADEIVAFAREYDPQPMHTDPTAAADGPFGGLIASGWHSCALMMRSLATWFREAEVQSLGSPGIASTRWLRPIRPGIVYPGRFTPMELRRASSRPMGIVRQEIAYDGPDGETVLRLVGTGFYALRPEAGR
jgi:acyl dehydratase